MLFGGIKTTKILGGALAAVLLMSIAIIGTLAWNLRGEMVKSASLFADKMQLERADRQNADAIERLKLEIALKEEVLQEHRDEIYQLTKDSAQSLAAIKEELNRLRAKHENVDEFFNLIVPAEYVNARMRDPAASRDSNKSGTDTSASGPAYAQVPP